MKFITDASEMFASLEKYIPKEIQDDLMYMGNDGPEDKIFLYKHINTRRYINVDGDGNFYIYNGARTKESYIKINKEQAIENLFS